MRWCVWGGGIDLQAGRRPPRFPTRECWSCWKFQTVFSVCLGKELLRRWHLLLPVLRLFYTWKRMHLIVNGLPLKIQSQPMAERSENMSSVQENSTMSTSKDSIIKKKDYNHRRTCPLCLLSSVSNMRPMVEIIIGKPVFSAAENLEAAIFLQAGQALVLQVHQYNIL